MRHSLPAGLLGLLFYASPLQASDVGFNINLSIGNQPAPRVVRAMPVVIEEPPLFLYPPQLGFAVAVGIPYDLIYIEGRYYMLHDDRWYVGSRYDGPWQAIRHKHLPPGLRKHKVQYIHDCRDREYHSYRRVYDDGGYRGRVYHPDKDRHKHKHKRKHDDD